MSGVARLNVSGVKPVIIKDPVSMTAGAGQTVTFITAAAGTEMTYQWQYKTPGGTWKNSTAAGNTTAMLSVEATASKNGWTYRCVVKNSKGTVYSKEAVLMVK